MGISGRLFLSGGGDEKQTFDIDEIFLQNVNSVLYIPVAWKNDDFEGCLNWFQNAMSQHKKIKIEMLTDLSEGKTLEVYGAVYIGGGNTFKLLKRLKDSGFDKKLFDYYESGGTVYGGSAGAIIWGKNINIAGICVDKDVNEVELEDTNGFDALGGIDIQCHYDESQLREQQEYVAKSGRDIIAIPDESALLLEGEKLWAIGRTPVTLITEDGAKVYKVNQEIRLPDTTPKRSSSKV